MNLKLTYLLFIFLTNIVLAQDAEQYFEKIRDNTALLTAFMSQMPKGGDLHHHFAGSLYAEPLLEKAIRDDIYLNLESMAVAKEKPVSGNWARFSELASRGELSAYKQKIMQRWSVKDFTPGDYPSDKLFFESFEKFLPVVADNFEAGMLELKERAIKENVSYLETQFSHVLADMKTKDLRVLNEKLRAYDTQKEEANIMNELSVLHGALLGRGAKEKALAFNKDFVARMHDKLNIDDETFTMRYQNFVFRFMDPVDLFANMVLSFISAENSDLIVGVNIVAPEDGEVSMKDYALHMLMFKFCKERYPSVKFAIHAGELTMGMVQPEDLTWHVDAAVRTAGAYRIGHGVDIVHEKNCYDLLRYMSTQKIPIEVSLSSNEFILKLKDDKHPLEVFYSFGVPILICTDDGGVLRTNLTEQYVMLAKRYSFVTYADIKRFVYNSIEYSFIEEPDVKKRLKQDLDRRFEEFEGKLPR